MSHNYTVYIVIMYAKSRCGVYGCVISQVFESRREMRIDLYNQRCGGGVPFEEFLLCYFVNRLILVVLSFI